MQEFRAELKTLWMAQGRACAQCGQEIDWDAAANTPNAFELDHVLPVKTHPDLEFVASNCAPTHHRCNRGKGAGPGHPGAGITSENW